MTIGIHLRGDNDPNVLDGTSGNDWLEGLGGNDKLNGLDGNDTIDGGSGVDEMNGGNGNDILIGGVGIDVLIGGLGNDRFDFNFISESLPGPNFRDVIRDFDGVGSDPVIGKDAPNWHRLAGILDPLVGDVIDLSTIDANSTIDGNQRFNWIGGSPFGPDATAQARYDSANGIIQVSTDSDKAPEMEILLTGAPALFVNPFFLGSDVIL